MVKINRGSLIGEILETGGTTAKKAGKAIAQTPGAFVKTATGQLGAKSQDEKADKNTNGVSSNQNQTQEVVEFLYGKSQKQQHQTQPKANIGIQPKGDGKQVDPEKVSKGIRDQLGLAQMVKPADHPELQQKTPEEQKKLADLRQTLHKEYYEKLVNPPKKQEETVAEKVEREKKEDRWELEKKEEKKKPIISIQRAKQRVERLRGVSG